MLIKKALLSAFFIVCILFTRNTTAQTNLLTSTVEQNKNVICPKLSDFDETLIYQDKIGLIVDGDTIYTKNGNKLKLIHINAPEINHKDNALSEGYSIQSRDRLAQLFKNDSTIFWVYDKKHKDRYKRDLVLAFDSQGLFINLEMVKSGLAQLLVNPPNHQYWQCLYSAEKKAIQDKNNIWNDENNLIISPQLLNKNSRFKTVQGVVTKILTDKTYRWIVLDDHLWVGIKSKDLKYFSKDIFDYKVGSKMQVSGYVFEYYNKLRMSLKHPSMILPAE